MPAVSLWRLTYAIAYNTKPCKIAVALRKSLRVGHLRGLFVRSSFSDLRVYVDRVLWFLSLASEQHGYSDLIIYCDKMSTNKESVLIIVPKCLRKVSKCVAPLLLNRNKFGVC